ncbi:SgcJ/EcaC family oxidoreductase [Pirellulales bacterium]|nr:SgcJ/EcaC family oxidoreductase [Pirellulales bacterium]
MKKVTWRCLACCVAVAAQGPLPALAMDSAADKAEIEKSVASYVAAFNASDSKALAAHWSPEAVYTNPNTGNQVTGREAIQKEFDAILSELKGSSLVAEVESIEFVSPNVAVERGTAIVTGPEERASVSRYSAVHLKQSGKWLLDRVTESDETAPISHYEQLQGLEWMIGTWLDADDNGTIETNCRWTRNKNFIVRSFKVVVEDRIDSSGMQFIGWDPAEGRIRSWAFDSNGGFAIGKWKNQEGRWIVESNSTLPDGRKGSSINTMTVVDENTFGWQSTGREVGGNLMPNIDEVKITRVVTPE